MAMPRWVVDQHNPGMIAEGFYESANDLVKILEERPIGARVDLRFQPIATMYRHYLELTMKSLVQQGMDLQIIRAKDIAKEYGHNLHRLWNQVKAVAIELNDGA